MAPRSPGAATPRRVLLCMSQTAGCAGAICRSAGGSNTRDIPPASVCSGRPRPPAGWPTKYSLGAGDPQVGRASARSRWHSGPRAVRRAPVLNGVRCLFGGAERAERSDQELPSPRGTWQATIANEYIPTSTRPRSGDPGDQQVGTGTDQRGRAGEVVAWVIGSRTCRAGDAPGLLQLLHRRDQHRHDGGGADEGADDPDRDDEATQGLACGVHCSQ